MLTADLIARAVVASTISYGGCPIEAMTGGESGARRPAVTACCALNTVLNTPLNRLARIMHLSASDVAKRRARGDQQFRRAQYEAEEAIRWALKGLSWSPFKPAPPATPPPAQRPKSLHQRAKDAEKAWRGAPRGRQVPRSARIENLGGGVQVIRLKPITESIIRHAGQQVRKGVSVDDCAELFEVDPEALWRGLKAAGVEVPA